MMINSVYIEYLSYGLQVVLIVLSLAIVLSRNNGKIVILIASFSLVISSLYLINKAPDVAIAEIAIGSAIIPLIYIISISRQREFIVVDRTNDDFIISSEGLSGIGFVILDRLTTFYNLELDIKNDLNLKRLDNKLDRMIIARTNIDMIVSKDETTGEYVFKGKKSNVLMRKLESLCKPYTNIRIEYLEDSDYDD